MAKKMFLNDVGEKVDVNQVMIYPRKCNCCGKLHTKLPEGTILELDFGLYYFNCTCMSTLVIPQNKVWVNHKQIKGLKLMVPLQENIET